ncbi:pyrroloquinoline quinone precursor peptide PqqA [Cohnella yongneupensis]|uniref:Coenzyme PQQ synthesis protein A n=1 Tax=Cohnella yongneupensis TaxID=425006 RepID=A0ABW0R3K1_9BACL
MNQVTRRDSWKGGVTMWVKPAFKIVEICAEVTAYAYRK